MDRRRGEDQRRRVNARYRFAFGAILYDSAYSTSDGKHGDGTIVVFVELNDAQRASADQTAQRNDGGGNKWGLYDRWCDTTKQKEKRKHYWRYVEKDGGRDEIHHDLAETVRSHYDRLERIAEDVERLGYKVAATILREAMPQTVKGRSGDLGEILATELVEEEIGLRVPVKPSAVESRNGRSNTTSVCSTPLRRRLPASIGLSRTRVMGGPGWRHPTISGSLYSRSRLSIQNQASSRVGCRVTRRWLKRCASAAGNYAGRRPTRNGNGVAMLDAWRGDQRHSQIAKGARTISRDWGGLLAAVMSVEKGTGRGG